ncbi:MAG TPA: M1 family aminopeptidase, partial [Rubricoccaceae bacterium]
EGPATYLTADVLGRLDGADTGLRHLARIVRETTPEDARRRLVPEALGRPEEALSLTVYNKGAAVMHLLRLRVGERAFWRALRAVQTEHGTRPLSTAAFQRAFERASGRDLGALFAYWVSGTRVPRLRTDWDGGTRTLSWTLSGDGGTLRGLPVRLLVRQGGAERVVRLSAGRVRMPGRDRPDIWPVGVLFDVD